MPLKAQFGIAGVAQAHYRRHGCRRCRPDGFGRLKNAGNAVSFDVEAIDGSGAGRLASPVHLLDVVTTAYGFG